MSTQHPSATGSSSSRAVVLAGVVDLVLVIAFAAIGRASHDEDALAIAGLWTTAWPFLAGLAIGWTIALAWRAPIEPVRTGLPVWAVTVVGGMILRAASGQGVQVAFVIVAAIVLLVFLVGWRLIARLVGRLRRQ